MPARGGLVSSTVRRPDEVDQKCGERLDGMLVFHSVVIVGVVRVSGAIGWTRSVG